MKTFKEFTEALNMQQRMKAKATFRKNKAKIAAGRKRAEKKTASPEVLKKRARKTARKEVEKKLLKGKSKDELSLSQRQSLEKKVDAKKGLVNRLSKKLIPVMKKKEKERKAAKASSSKEG